MRKWHRWISVPTILFLIVVGISGLVLQVKGFLNDDEEAQEQLADAKSKIAANDAIAKLHLEAAIKTVVDKYENPSLKKIEIEFRKTPIVLTFYIDGTIPKIIQVDNDTGKVVSEKVAVENDFWIKLHSGEIFGDFGRSVGIFSGLALLFLSVSGGWIYFQMFRRRPTAQSLWKRIFW